MGLFRISDLPREISASTKLPCTYSCRCGRIALGATFTDLTGRAIPMLVHVEGDDRPISYACYQNVGGKVEPYASYLVREHGFSYDGPELPVPPEIKRVVRRAKAKDYPAPYSPPRKPSVPPRRVDWAANENAPSPVPKRPKPVATEKPTAPAPFRPALDQSARPSAMRRVALPENKVVAPAPALQPPGQKPPAPPKPAVRVTRHDQKVTVAIPGLERVSVQYRDEMDKWRHEGVAMLPMPTDVCESVTGLVLNSHHGPKDFAGAKEITRRGMDRRSRVQAVRERKFRFAETVVKLGNGKPAVVCHCEPDGIRESVLQPTVPTLWFQSPEVQSYQQRVVPTVAASEPEDFDAWWAKHIGWRLCWLVNRLIVLDCEESAEAFIELGLKWLGETKIGPVGSETVSGEQSAEESVSDQAATTVA
jgi:hypothetical protein